MQLIIKDDIAFEKKYSAWTKQNYYAFAGLVLKDKDFWGVDLTTINGFAGEV